MATTPLRTYGVGILEPLKNPQSARVTVLNLKPSTTYPSGTLLGPITASPGVYGPYATGNADGTQNPTHILQYACKTDASGNVAFGDQTAGEWGQTTKGAPAFRSGVFDTKDLVGLDAGAVTKLGRLESGTVADGVLQVYGS